MARLAIMDRAVPRAGPKPASYSAAAVYTHLVCISCLCLQRFGLPFSGGEIFLSLVIVPPATLWLMLSGQARITVPAALLFATVACCVLISTIGGVIFPDPRMRLSILSLGEFLVIYAVLLPEPAETFDSYRVLPIFVFYVRLIAVLGIVEYAAQFVGVRLFSFTQMVPSLHPFSTEYGYNTVAITKYGSSILRSNGFFLLEPSILSQVAAIGIVVDYFVLSRPTFLPIYAAAMLVSYSGTGLLALGLTLILVGFVSPRQLQRTILFVVIAVVVAGLFAVAFPAEFATMAGRASGSDASSNLRYTSQLTVLKTVLDDARVIVGFGPGAADGYSEGVFGSMSPALKLFFDYGLIGIIAFSAFLVKILWRRDIAVLSVICLINFQFGGGYLVFSPWVFLFGLVCIWSRPATARRVGGLGLRLPGMPAATA